MVQINNYAGISLNIIGEKFLRIMGTFQPALLVRIFIYYAKFLAVCSDIGFIAIYSGN